jgi:hypothetical protein
MVGIHRHTDGMEITKSHFYFLQNGAGRLITLRFISLHKKLMSREARVVKSIITWYNFLPPLNG